MKDRGIQNQASPPQLISLPAITITIHEELSRRRIRIDPVIQYIILPLGAAEKEKKLSQVYGFQILFQFVFC
jgi:hypothetical protein